MEDIYSNMLETIKHPQRQRQGPASTLYSEHLELGTVPPVKGRFGGNADNDDSWVSTSSSLRTKI